MLASRSGIADHCCGDRAGRPRSDDGTASDGGWSQLPTLESDAYATGRQKAGRRAISYTGAMRSKVATDVSQTRARRLAAMTPAERIALARRLGDEGVAAYMTTHGVDRRTAIVRIKATHQVGRRPSRCTAANES